MIAHKGSIRWRSKIACAQIEAAVRPLVRTHVLEIGINSPPQHFILIINALLACVADQQIAQREAANARVDVIPRQNEAAKARVILVGDLHPQGVRNLFIMFAHHLGQMCSHVNHLSESLIFAMCLERKYPKLNHKS